MYPKKVTPISRGRKRSVLRRWLLTSMGSNTVLAAFLTVGAIIGLLAFVVTTAPKIVQADMLSVLRNAFNGYTTSQNPISNPSTNSSIEVNATTSSTNACPAGEIILGSTGSGLRCGPPSSLTNPNPTNHTWLCPDGQVESGTIGRPPNPINCVPCPRGTVRMFAAGAEACHLPSWVPDYSSIPAGYQIGANGEVCRADGQTYAGSPTYRYRFTYPGYGECCNGGVRSSQTLVPGSSVALFMCGAPGSPTSGYDYLPGPTGHANGYGPGGVYPTGPSNSAGSGSGSGTPAGTGGSGRPVGGTAAGSIEDTAYRGGPVDPKSTFIISSPTNGSTITGDTIVVSYYSTADVLPTDYVVLQLDGRSINTSTGGTYKFGEVSPGIHVIRGYIAHADGSKVANTSSSSSFTAR